MFSIKNLLQSTRVLQTSGYAHTQTSRNIDQRINIHTIKYMDIGVDRYENVYDTYGRFLNSSQIE